MKWLKRFVFLLVLLLILFSPRIAWTLKEKYPLDLFVIDKTVPKTDYREHNGLFMILDQNKIVQETGPHAGQFYDIGRDYFGYDPYDQIEVRRFPTTTKLDLLYVADTYGVYGNDLEKKPDGQRSSYIYGGMDLLEWNMVMDYKSKDTVLIAEFNSFATPTESVTSEIMQKNLGVRWTEWIGRYFPSLESDEVPPWLIRNYEAQYNKPWHYEGPGIAFVHTSDRVVVLNEGENEGKVAFRLTEEGKSLFPKADDSYYMYWFDIVEPVGSSQILANYHLEITNEGKKELNENGIPLSFPAIIHQPEEKTYYFAGDYADYPNKVFTRWLGLGKLYKHFASENNQFYWWSYVPLMNDLLTDLRQDQEEGLK